MKREREEIWNEVEEKREGDRREGLDGRYTSME